MPNALDRIFNLYTLIAVNIAIILAAELIGGGHLFFDTGIIHIIAILFIILASTRIGLHYYSYDAFLEKFFHASLAALFLFSFSHIVEFVGYMVLHLKEDAVFANVANFYIACLLIIALGAESFLSAHDGRKEKLAWAIRAGVVLITAFIVYLFFNDQAVSLDDRFTQLLYAAVLLGAGLFAYMRVSRIGKLVSISRGFIGYMKVTLVFIMFAALASVFYDLLKDAGLPEYQVIYLAHFFFYASLSTLFLAFGTLARLTGVYADLRSLRGE